MNRSLALISSSALLFTACMPATSVKTETSASSSSNSIEAMRAKVVPEDAMKREPVAMKREPSGTMKKSVASSSSAKKEEPKPMPKTDAEWKAVLTADQYAVLRQGGTETPFTSPLVDEHRKGTFYSVDCNEPVFRSEQKFDSGTGWPSFWAPMSKNAVTEKTDTTFGMQRTEVLSTCGGHLGHVFDDGPQPTGLRYCMNGVALRFVPDAQQ